MRALIVIVYSQREIALRLCITGQFLPRPQGEAMTRKVPASPNARIGLREQSRLEVMRRIRAAAVDLLATKPYASITTKEVAQHAGIGDATFFRYVSSKDELLTLAYGDRMDSVLDELEREDDRIEEAGEAEDGHWYCDRIRNLYRARADFYLQDPVNASLYLRQGFDIASPGCERAIQQGDRLIARARRIIADGQAAGRLIAGVDPLAVAQNCQGIFIHEVDRTPVRGFEPETIWQRVDARLSAQLDPLVLDGRSAGTDPSAS
ncbi:TetR/AcrR family transcriptional regulator [Nocardia sp. NPDC050378]|uniref:TetR/AcrR family transcriptional regulator n=1 Tax=Nocardia sp. NPDC050378 TaxID=3155400 RepID=UPI0033FE7739